MNTKLTTIASLAATTIWADGEYNEAEKIAVAEIADAFEFDSEEFCAAVNAEVDKITDFSDEDLGEYIINVANEVDENEVEFIFEAVLQLIISDNVVSLSEVSTALSLADALGIEHESAILLLLDLVKSEPELEIECD